MASLPSESKRGIGDGPGADPKTTSTVPLLDRELSEAANTQSPTRGRGITDDHTEDNSDTPKSSKRKFWNLGKKKAEEKPPPPMSNSPNLQASSAPIAPAATMRPSSPMRLPDTRESVSPHRSRQLYSSPASPGRNVHSSSPRPHSPVSSQIFERSVQEEIGPSQASPAIPSHIMTENHIPPVLEASSAAITDDHLDPDTVEIVTHTAHQPAAVTVTGTADPSSASFSLAEDAGSAFPGDFEDSGSNYATLDTSDVRRLSFISFADVVHAEHSHDQDGHSHLPTRDSVQNLTGLSSAAIPPPRSPSPLQSPISSHGGTALGTSPPSSVSPSFKGVESSPNRGGRGAPASPLALPAHSPPLGGEFNVETMRQALRKTGSGDLSGYRSQPMSAVGDADTEVPFGRSLK